MTVHYSIAPVAQIANKRQYSKIVFLPLKNLTPKNVSNKIKIWGLKFHIYTFLRRSSSLRAVFSFCLNFQPSTVISNLTIQHSRKNVYYVLLYHKNCSCLPRRSGMHFLKLRNNKVLCRQQRNGWSSPTPTLAPLLFFTSGFLFFQCSMESLVTFASLLHPEYYLLIW